MVNDIRMRNVSTKVGNPQTTQRDLLRCFIEWINNHNMQEIWGPIASVKIPFSCNENLATYYGYVSFQSTLCHHDVVDKMNKVLYQNIPISMEINPKPTIQGQRVSHMQSKLVYNTVYGRSLLVQTTEEQHSEREERRTSESSSDSSYFQEREDEGSDILKNNNCANSSQLQTVKTKNEDEAQVDVDVEYWEEHCSIVSNKNEKLKKEIVKLKEELVDTKQELCDYKLNLEGAEQQHRDEINSTREEKEQLKLNNINLNKQVEQLQHQATEQQLENKRQQEQLVQLKQRVEQALESI